MGLHPTLVKVRRNLPRVAQSLGFNARVTSGYRSPAKQAWLYQRYLAGLQPYPVAPPGYSDHEKGTALDVVSTDMGKLVSLLTSAGLSWGGPEDPVHFSLSARKSQKATISTIQKSWEAGPGASLPSFLSFLPIVGTAFQVAKSPIGAAKAKASTLVDVILGFL